jgi:hypothetical protein
MIYLIVNKEENICKIGYSDNPNARLKTLQTGCPYPLSIYAIIEGDVKKEKLIHKMFSLSRTHNEWFSYTDDIKKYFEAGERLCCIDMRWFDSVSNIENALPSHEIIFLFWLYYKYPNNTLDVYLYKELLNEYCERYSVSRATIDRYVKKLAGMKMLIKKGKGVYSINPRFLFNGDFTKRSNLVYQLENIGQPPIEN